MVTNRWMPPRHSSSWITPSIFGAALLRESSTRGLPSRPGVKRVAWEPSASPDVDHYNVYCGREAGFEPGAAALVASRKQCELIDWGLDTEGTWHYRITAVDQRGNESEATLGVGG